MKKHNHNKIDKIVQVSDGQLLRHSYRKDGTSFVHNSCCDCGLVHLFQYIPRKRYLGIRAWRDVPLTRALRKRGNQKRRRPTS